MEASSTESFANVRRGGDEHVIHLESIHVFDEAGDMTEEEANENERHRLLEERINISLLVLYLIYLLASTSFMIFCLVEEMHAEFTMPLVWISVQILFQGFAIIVKSIRLYKLIVNPLWDSIPLHRRGRFARFEQKASSPAMILWTIWLGFGIIIRSSFRSSPDNYPLIRLAILLHVIINFSIPILLFLVFSACCLLKSVLGAFYSSSSKNDSLAEQRLKNTQEVTCEYGSSALKYEDKMCSICLCEYLPKEKLRILLCGHHFHTECIRSWLARSNFCPLCKHVVSFDTDYQNAHEDVVQLEQVPSAQHQDIVQLEQVFSAQNGVNFGLVANEGNQILTHPKNDEVDSN